MSKLQRETLMKWWLALVSIFVVTGAPQFMLVAAQDTTPVPGSFEAPQVDLAVLTLRPSDLQIVSLNGFGLARIIHE